MANYVYDIGYDELSSGGLTLWGTTTIWSILLTATYVFDATDVFVSDLSSELAGGGYARQNLANFTRILTVSGEVLSRTGLTIYPLLQAAAGTPGWQILARNTGIDATARLLGAFQLPGTPGDGGNYTLTPPTDGYFLLGPVSPYTLPEMLTFSSGR